MKSDWKFFKYIGFIFMVTIYSPLSENMYWYYVMYLYMLSVIFKKTGPIC